MFTRNITDEMARLKIDHQLTQSILDNLNTGKYESSQSMVINHLPDLGDKRIVDTRNLQFWSLEGLDLGKRIKQLGCSSLNIQTCKGQNNQTAIAKNELARLGRRLYEKTAYGILNGGAATSYVDVNKNRAFDADLFNLLRMSFNKIAALSQGKPKGITPAISHPNGQPGPAFLELKMRALLIAILRFQKEFSAAGGDRPLFPLFQMDSVVNHGLIEAACRDYRKSPLLSDLMEVTGIDITRTVARSQPLISAFALNGAKSPRYRLFDNAYGRGELLALPGGHGQCFAVLKDLFEQLRQSGKRYAYLGNVDNLANLPDPVTLAVFALSNKSAAFEFSFKTSTDVKGGILIEDKNNRLNCGDIGVSIPEEIVKKAEKPLLFNCASAVFDLEYLIANIDRIISHLPTRITRQEKEAGSYLQTEQIAWEAIGVIDDPLILAVDKFQRFLPAKTALESLLTSGAGLANPDFPARHRSQAQKLNSGLCLLLARDYGLRREGGFWKTLPAAAL